MDDAPADANVADGGDLADRALECVDERRAVRGREIGPRLHQHEVRQHGALLVRRFVVAPLAGVAPLRGEGARAAAGFIAPRLSLAALFRFARRLCAPRALLALSGGRRLPAPWPIGPIASRRAGRFPVLPRLIASRRTARRLIA